MNENRRKQMTNIKEIILVLLLVIWMIIPVLKELRLTSLFVINYEDIYVKIVGLIGLVLLYLEIFKKFQDNKNSKEYIKQILPILILYIFMLWTLIATIFAKDITKALFGTEYRKDGYISYLGYAGFFSFAYLIKSKENRKELLIFFVITAIVNIILVELWNNGFCSNIIEPRVINKTCFFNSNHYGYYLTLATVVVNFLFVTEKNRIKRIIYMAEYLFLLYYIMLNNTFGCYLALAFTLIAFLGYCIYHKQKRVIAITSIAIFILMSVVNPKVNNIVFSNINSLISDFNNLKISVQSKDSKEAILEAERGGSGRIRLWKYGLKFFAEKPLLGYGPENLEVKYKEVGIVQDRPHNLLIQLLTTSGIIGMSTYILAIGIILFRGIKSLRYENDIHIIAFFTVFAYLISAMFGNSMYYTSPYFFIFLGFLMIENMENDNKLEKHNNTY